MLENISVLKTATENFDLRAKTLSRSRKDIEFQQDMNAFCAENIIPWVNLFCWTYEPRSERQKLLNTDSPHLPFITWEFQDDYILWLQKKIENQEDGLTEKSRDMGASWMTISVLLYFWLYQGPGNDFLIGSRKEEFVDKHGEMDALFPKLRYQLYHLPVWMRPKGFDPKEHDHYMRLLNPDTKSYIKGESNNKFFGSGGRYKAVLLDEFAKWEHTDEEAWQSLSDATDCKLPVSSAHGRNNQFYNLRSGDKIEKMRLHWSEHPLKDHNWYVAESKRRSPADLAAEVDIDYSASISNKAYENFSYDIHCDNVECDPNLEIELQCDFNVDPMCWCLSQEIKGESRYFDEIASHSTITETVTRELFGRYKDHKNKMVHIYGDATGKARSTRSRQSDYDIMKKVLAQMDWKFVTHISPSNPPVTERVQAVNKRLRDWENENKSWIVIDPNKCPVLIDSFEQTRRKDDGLDKSDNIEHMTDGVGYRIEKKYPIRSRKIGSRAW